MESRINYKEVEELVFRIQTHLGLIKENFLDRSFCMSQIHSVEVAYENLKGIYCGEVGSSVDDRERQKYKSQTVALLYYLSKRDDPFLLELYKKLGVILRDPKKRRIDDMFSQVYSLKDECTSLKTELRKAKKNNEFRLSNFSRQLETFGNCLHHPKDSYVQPKLQISQSSSSDHLPFDQHFRDNQPAKANSQPPEKLFFKKKIVKQLTTDGKCNSNTPFLLSFGSKISSKNLIFPLTIQTSSKKKSQSQPRRRASTRSPMTPGIQSPSSVAKDVIRILKRKNGVKEEFMGRITSNRRVQENNMRKKKYEELRMKRIRQKLYWGSSKKTKKKKLTKVASLGASKLTVEKKKLEKRKKHEMESSVRNILGKSNSSISGWKNGGYESDEGEFLSASRNLSKYTPIVEQPRLVFKNRKTGRRIVIKTGRSNNSLRKQGGRKSGIYLSGTSRSDFF